MPDVGQRKGAAAPDAHRSAGVQAGDARKVPSRGNAARTKQAIKWKIPVVAQYEVMPQVERRRSIVTRSSARVTLGRDAIQRMGVGIADQKGQVASATFRRNLQ